jgi:hypothetical protein
MDRLKLSLGSQNSIIWLSELQRWASKLYDANPQIFGLIPLSQIGKFLGCASLQIANPQILMINPLIGIRKFLQNTAQLCLKNIPKSRLFKIFIYLFCTMN